MILSPTKIRLLQQILASPTGALSLPELAARNTITESTIRDHLVELQNHEPQIVTTLEPSESPVPDGMPRIYYAVSECGITLLEQLDLYDQIGPLFDVYESADLSLPNPDDHILSLEEIETYEHRPTPEWL